MSDYSELVAKLRVSEHHEGMSGYHFMNAETCGQAANAIEALMSKVKVARRGFELIIEREKTAFSAAALEMARQASMSLQKMEE